MISQLLFVVVSREEKVRYRVDRVRRGVLQSSDYMCGIALCLCGEHECVQDLQEEVWRSIKPRGEV